MKFHVILRANVHNYIKNRFFLSYKILIVNIEIEKL